VASRSGVVKISDPLVYSLESESVSGIKGPKVVALGFAEARSRHRANFVDRRVDDELGDERGKDAAKGIHRASDPVGFGTLVSGIALRSPPVFISITSRTV
jgi:hypothetical protein